MKKCTKCKLNLAISKFSKNRSKPDGYNYWCKNCYNRYKREYTKKNYEKNNQINQNYHKKFPERRKAMAAVYRALKSGKLLKINSCECCGGQETEAHHEDYNKKLEVVWLCHKCHMLLPPKQKQDD